jgi:transposase
VCRFLEPTSKLKVYEHWQNKLYPEMLSGKDDLHHIYRAIDLLSEHKEDIERGLFWHDRDLLNMDVDVVLYDLTTLRFESTREDLGELRRFGYSKEMRSDCIQVILGLLVDTNGIPLGFEVYPRNTFEGSTLEDIVSRMRNKFRVRRFIFVADRGLFSVKNLEHIRSSCGPTAEEPGEFIVGMKLGLFKKRHDEFYDRKRFKQINDQFELYETIHEGDRCIITWSAVRAERDRKTREDIINKIKKKLKSPKASGKTFVSNTNYRKYVAGLEEGALQLDEKVIVKEAQRDVFFLELSPIFLPRKWRQQMLLQPISI